jgi:hypothetical protein
MISIIPWNAYQTSFKLHEKLFPRCCGSFYRKLDYSEPCTLCSCSFLLTDYDTDSKHDFFPSLQRIDTKLRLVPYKTQTRLLQNSDILSLFPKLDSPLFFFYPLSRVITSSTQFFYFHASHITSLGHSNAN